MKLWDFLNKNTENIADEEIRKTVIKIKDDEKILKKRKERAVELFEKKLLESGVVSTPDSEDESDDA